MSAGGTSRCRGFIFLSLHLSVSLVHGIVLRRVMCDRRPPVDVHHRAGSASLIRTLPCGVWNSGRWDALVVLSVVEQLDVVRAVLAGDVTGVAARLGMHRSTCNGGWPGIRLISRRGWRTGCIGPARTWRRSPWPVGATHANGSLRPNEPLRMSRQARAVRSGRHHP
jgi:hypothetical protein